MPWELAGNAGIDPNTNFLGTTDAQPLVIKTHGTEAVRVTADGKVGVGNSNPAFKLEVTAPDQLGLAIQRPNSGVGTGLQLQSTGPGAPGGPGGRGWELLATGATSAQGAGKFNIRDLGSARDDFTITSGGNIGMGTTNPQTKLHVAGGLRADGISGDSDKGPGVLGTSDIGVGVHGFSNDGAGVRGESIRGFAGDFNGNVRVNGSFSVTGHKAFVQAHPSDPNREIVYVALEGGEAGTYVRGSGQLQSGKAVLELPEHFGLVTENSGLTVQLTPHGEWLQLYMVELDTAQLVVREAQGKSGSFDYLIQGVRRGYEQHEVIRTKR